jgi:hypothetical protein
MKLDPTVPFGAGEAPASFVSRLARRNGIRSVREFCSDLCLPFQRIVDGCRDALTRVAELTGMALEPLLHEAIRKQENSSFILRGESLVRQSLRRERILVCPACLNEDQRSSDLPREVAPYGRTIWNIVHIRTCRIHSVPLLQIARAGHHSLNHDFAFLIQPSIASIERLADRGEPRPASGLECYLLDRLEGSSANRGWLDSLPLYAAARTCEMLGAVAVFGRQQNLKYLTDDDWFDAGAAGFKIAHGGEASINCFLNELRSTPRKHRHGTNGPQAWFGRFYQWLAFGAPDPAYDCVRDIIAQHLVENAPLVPEDKLFEKPVLRRKRHSIRTAFLETGLHPTRLRKILAATGHLPPDHSNLSDHEATFDAVATNDLLRRFRTALTHLELSSYLNAHRVQTKQLVDCGYIRPIIEGSADEIGWRCYAREDVDAFLQRLASDSVSVDRAPPGTFTISDAAKRTCCRTTEIVDLILSRQLKWVGRLSWYHGYNAILVQVSEIRAHVRGRELDGYTLSKVPNSLRVNAHAVNALVEKGILQTNIQRHPVNRSPRRIVTAQELERFRRTYITLFEAAGILEMHHLALKRTLRDLGIKPALDPIEFHASFYKRELITSSIVEQYRTTQKLDDSTS